MTRQEFLNLDSKDRRNLAYNRMYKGDRWIVFDYYPLSNKTYGAFQKCPKPIDYGFQHGFVFKNPIVPISYNLSYDFEINAYWSYYIEDDTNTDTLYHIFTTKEKAEEYAKTLDKKLNHKITNDDVLKVLHTITQFKDAYVSVGKRGYETNTKQYETIVADGYGYTTMNIIDEKYIQVQFGQSNPYIIPHINLLKKAFENLIDNEYINYDYVEYADTWKEFYGIQS